MYLGEPILPVILYNFDFVVADLSSKPTTDFPSLLQEESNVVDVLERDAVDSDTHAVDDDDGCSCGKSRAISKSNTFRTNDDGDEDGVDDVQGPVVEYVMPRLSAV